jgi:N-acetylglucosamine-6-phosphate deacetylase
MNRLLITNVRIIRQNSISPGQVLVEDGKIFGLGIADTPKAHANTEIFDGRGCYLSPGFIDLHNHGRLGCDVMDSTEASMERIARGQAEHGVTGFLAGTSTISWEKIPPALGFLSSYCRKEPPPAAQNRGLNAQGQAVCLGIYSEGNFFSREKRGAHNPDWLKSSITAEDVDTVLQAAGGALKVVALSPELPGAVKAIERLTAAGIAVSAAHTNAAYTEAMAGINAGITLSTHTFNGMRSLHHQEPGILGAVLEDSRVSCELIADGIHLHKSILSLVYKLKGPDKIILISDSVAPNGLPEGNYGTGERKVTLSGGAIRLEDGRLAGSCLSLDRAVRNMVNLGGASLPQAVQMASHNPAQILGLDSRKGSIDPGKDADLVLFDDEIRVRGVFIGGNLYNSKPLLT